MLCVFVPTTTQYNYATVPTAPSAWVLCLATGTRADTTVVVRCADDTIDEEKKMKNEGSGKSQSKSPNPAQPQPKSQSN